MHFEIKRTLDLCLAWPAFLLVSPLILTLMALIRLTMGSPVLFCQRRAGIHGKAYLLYKLRSMDQKRDSAGSLLSDAERLTPLGRFLRRTSLDELPTLINVIQGDMSLVGPRPLLMSYLARYSPDQARRLEVRPGLTGWAQINGRNAISWEERFNLDVWYVDHQSLILDLRIMGRTVWQVLTGHGIAPPNHETMPEFTGTPKA